MHLGKFHAAITALNVDYATNEIAAKIQTVIQQLDSLSSNPGNSAVANIFKESFDALRQSLTTSSLNKSHPTLAALLDSIGARKFIGDELFQRIENLIVENGMTPQLAATALRSLFTEVSTFYHQINDIDLAFMNLGVEFEELEAGEGEIGISIPQPEGSRLLIDLAKTAKAWDIALRPFVELADPEHNPIVVKTIASSDWQFYLSAAPGVYLAVSAAISKLNELLKQLIETKKLISQLTSSGLSAPIIAAATAESDGMLDSETRKLAEKIVDEHSLADVARANELKTSVTSSLKFIARQMAENVTIEVRYLPPKKAESNDSTGPQEGDEAKMQLGHLTDIAAQIERNMDLIRLDGTAREMLNLPAPDEEAD